MTKLQGNQSGVAHIAHIALIALVVVLLIAGLVGWKVWDNNKKPAPNTAATSSNTPEPEKTTAPAETKEADTQSYLTIKEWGVKIPVSSTLTGLTYVIKTYPDGGQAVGFTLTSLKNTECNGEDSVGYITRFTENEINPMTNEKMIKGREDAPRIEDYYYTPSLPQAMCTEDTAVQEKVNNTRLPFTEAVKGIKKA